MKPTEWAQSWEHEESWLRKRVQLMRDLGVVQAWGIVLGPEPREPSKLEKLEKRAASEDSAEARRDLRVEQARDDLRAKMGNFDLSPSVLDPLLDPAIFELS